MWHNANLLVDPEKPGDFNQALMELGATICTPQNPNCSACPISKSCLAYEEVQKIKHDNTSKLLNIKSETTTDIEECLLTCNLCLSKNDEYILEDGVTNYPRKGKKSSQREETSLVCILKCRSSNSYCLLQRPENGLLANLMEFPSIPLSDCPNETKLTKSIILKLLQDHYSLKVAAKQVEELGNVLHIFSHIRQTYMVYRVEMTEEEYENIRFEKNKYQKMEWLSSNEVNTSAISTAMRKVFKLENKDAKLTSKDSKGMKRKVDGTIRGQPGIKGYFTAKAKS